MLQKMREFSKSWISNLFLGALTLSFVSWGVGDILRGGTSTAVATVGRTAIEQSEFQRDYTNFLRRQGKDLTPEQARRANLGSILLQQKIAQVALDNVARRLEMTISDDMVLTQIRATPDFAGISGTFDRGVFQQKVARIGYSEQGFIEIMRRDMARGQLMQAAEAGFEIPAGYAQALFAYSTELRAAEYVTVDAKALPPIAPPADAVLAAYVKGHGNRFSTPEYRDVTYAEIDLDDMSKGITITDQQIQSVYDANKDKYDIPENRDLEQIAFTSQADAQAARAKIAAGTSFAEIAASRGLKQSDLELGARVAADLDPAEAKAVFALPEGGVTEPVKVTFGWALVRVVKITQGHLTTLDQAKDVIKKALLHDLAEAKMVDVANAYTDAAGGGATLTAAAQKVGMHAGRVAAMDANGLAPDGSKVAAPDDPTFREQVFKSEAGEDNDPFQGKSGNYYVVSVNAVVPPKLRPLDVVRAQVLAAWTAEQRAILLQKKAAELAAQANKDKSIDGVAKAIGATVHSSPALTHDTNDATFSKELVAALYAASPGGAVYGPLGKGEGYIVARVTGVYHPLPPTDNPIFQQGAREISQGVAADVVESLAFAARDKQGVTINTKLLDTVVGGEGS
ncbi:MAG: peptidyl-prolyl cis-trans isomerase [Rhizomicrobium sp.]|jgi:peptidyl-prolyl cis-trans isomerase D